jgi:hypothetical protein
MTTRLAPVLLLVGCVAGPLPVLTIDARAEPSFDRIADACAWWGLDCVEADDNEGALTVFLTDERAFENDEPVGGKVFDRSACSPVLWADAGKHDLEHEMGHVLGLGKKHSSDVGNVMYAEDDGSVEKTSTDEQDDKVQNAAERLARCRGGEP